MKNILYIFVTAALIFMNTSCYDRDIIDSKKGVSLPSVENLAYTVSGNKATITWKMPSDIPSEMKRPLSVFIQIFEDGVRRDPVSLSEAETSFVKDIEPVKTYRIIVQLRGNIKEPQFGMSDLIFSLGQTITIGE